MASQTLEQHTRPRVCCPRVGHVRTRVFAREIYGCVRGEVDVFELTWQGAAISKVPRCASFRRVHNVYHVRYDAFVTVGCFFREVDSCRLTTGAAAINSARPLSQPSRRVKLSCE